MSAPEIFSYDRDESGIVTLTMDMPGRSQNVWGQASIDAFSAVLDRLAGDDAATGVIVTSGKKDFLAGADLQAIRQMTIPGRSAEELAATSDALGAQLRRLETCGKPVVAAINGTALGGGFELCLACHRRIVVDSPRIQLGLPESGLGLLPGAGGTQRLPRLIGIRNSLMPLMEGKRLRPGKALKLGMVDEAVPADQLLDAARAWLATEPPATQPWDNKGFEPPGGDMSNPQNNSMMMVSAAMYTARTFGNYPAGAAILSCVSEGLRLPLDQALLVEQRYFVKLLLDPVARNMVRTLFLSMQEANKLARRPEGPARKAPKKIGVLGAGLMGAGIAYVAAKSGIEVVIIDRDEEQAAKAAAYATAREDKGIARRRSTPEKKAAILGRIHPTTDYSKLEGCDVVVEAVFEDRDVKAAVTKAADAVLGDDAVFGSNTSTLPITGLAEASSRPARFIGLHFFSPVERMPLVEVITGAQTDDATLAWALDFVQALGKTPIVVRDARGFYTSRVFGTYVTEGMVMLEEGITPALIENAGKRSGMPMPPLSLADQVGLTLMAQVGRQTRADLGDAAPANPSTPVLEKMVFALDRGGARGGRGFYDYSEQGKQLWPGLGEHWPRAAAQPSAEALVERFLLVQVLEAIRCVEEGVISDAGDVDVGAILGWGFAAYTGGPLSYVDTHGAAQVLARAEALTAELGDRFAPPALLREMAAAGSTFYPTE